MDSIKYVVRSSVKVPEFDKHLKKAGGHTGRNVEEITIKMKTIGQKTLNDKNHPVSSQKFRRIMVWSICLIAYHFRRIFNSKVILIKEQ